MAPMMRERLNFLAVALLAGGLAAAALVWQAQDRIDRQNTALQAGDAGAVNSADPLPPADFRKHVRQVEIYYGQLGLVIEQLSDWASGLAQGKPLAKTIAALSAAAAAGLFALAKRLPADPRESRIRRLFRF